MAEIRGKPEVFGQQLNLNISMALAQEQASLEAGTNNRSSCGHRQDLAGVSLSDL